jgi:purine-nucleoside phosphorylase
VIHIHQTAELAERVLLPGDPGRALRMAQRLLDEPKMLNHNRGLWGYTGTAADLHRDLKLGQLLIVSEALSDDGTSRALAGQGSLAGDDPVVAHGSPVSHGFLPGDGQLRPVPSTPELLRSLREAALRAAPAGDIADGRVVSTDLFYGATDRHPGWIEAGALAVEMEAATIFTIAARRDVEAGCALLVSDTLHGDFQRIGEHALHEAELALGRLAVAALQV